MDYVDWHALGYNTAWQRGRQADALKLATARGAGPRELAWVAEGFRDARWDAYWEAE